MKDSIFLTIFIICTNLFTFIKLETDWKISFYDEEDINFEQPNEFNITKGNYQTIQVKLEYLKSQDIINNINTTLKLVNSELKMIPNEININTEKSLQYNIDLGIPCNIDLESIEIDFDFEDNNIKNKIEIKKCKANLKSIKKTISFNILNKEKISNNIFGKLYIKQDFKNFEKINIKFSKDVICDFSKYFLDIENIVIDEYKGDFNIYYTIAKGNKGDGRKRDEVKKCDIEAKIESEENKKCFEVENKKINLNYYNTLIDINKETFYHNSIVSSYIDINKKNKTDENSLSLYFFKESYYFSSFCVIQDKNIDFLSNEEILNQRINKENKNKNFIYSFSMEEFYDKDYEVIINFKNLEKKNNYKIKCIYDFLDEEDKLEITYGEGMQISRKINFNETKTNLLKNCSEQNHMKNKNLDTRYCDIINHRLIFKMFYEMNLKYKLQYFNNTDFLLYYIKNNNEKIEHLKDIINNNKSILLSENDILSAASDYLFIIDCQENKSCQMEKENLFQKILFKYNELNTEKINIEQNEQDVINDIFLFNNILENSDTINYDNFEIIVNKILNKRNSFFSNSTRVYNHYLSNLFLLIFDKFISIINNFKLIYFDKFEIDKKSNIYKSDLLINFYNLFIKLISNGLVNREYKINAFAKNIFVNFVDTPVSENIQQIIDNPDISIKGFDTEESKRLYYNIYSAGAISYMHFPLFPSDNKKSKATTFFLYTEDRNNFIKEELSYSESFKIIFKKKNSDNYCYLWNNDYSNNNKEIINNFVSTEYLNKDEDKNYDVNCVSRVMISPMTIILGQNDINGSIFKEGMSFFSILIVILITFCLILISLPFLLSFYYKKQTESAKQILNELN